MASKGLGGVLRSVLDPRTLVHAVRLAHFYGYSWVQEVRKLHRGANVSFGPTVSFRNAERIYLGAGSHLGEGSVIWAGNTQSRVVLGEKTLLAPNVTITASNYGIVRGTPVMDQPKIEKDIVIGPGVWLGANVVVTAGVTIGAGAIVGAGAVVTRDLPENCIAGGVPARVIGHRPAAPAEPDGAGTDSQASQPGSTFDRAGIA
ncbi:acetyltransferase-like isoleucine patch superfamily enzyme [Okibacterium sp. HSC-33S16]|uniref:acyltransferase n=1 Tax=Okibacterium sp. HSC-33S16 TaxID=2910965 RepID=UPI0027E25B6E|nr:acyltransferase [Okibacterium sp. HSC-33S16]MCP2032074.1 acetyltransferase-like isoleucine patch superfamily enzyme [Okibacterium sp. HSC-33S16]